MHMSDYEEHRHSEPLAEPPQEALERAAEIFGAAGDPGRLRILVQLLEGERCVSELKGAEAMSTISQRLKVLWNAGLVAKRRAGKHIFYGLADGHVEALVRNAFEHSDESQ